MAGYKAIFLGGPFDGEKHDIKYPLLVLKGSTYKKKREGWKITAKTVTHNADELEGVIEHCYLLDPEYRMMSQDGNPDPHTIYSYTHSPENTKKVI